MQKKSKNKFLIKKITSVTSRSLTTAEAEKLLSNYSVDLINAVLFHQDLTLVSMIMKRSLVTSYPPDNLATLS
jgi:hypothetical protein